MGAHLQCKGVQVNHPRSSTPFWIKTRFGGRCSQCGLGIKKGESAFYYPATRAILCARDCCGKKAERDLHAEDFDVAVLNYQG